MLSEQKANMKLGKKVILELEAEEVLRIITVLMRYQSDYKDDNISEELMNHIMNQFDNYWNSYYSHFAVGEVKI